VTEADTVRLLVSDGGSCSLERKTALIISEPKVHVESTGYEIVKGQSVQLQATGGESYEWSPALGLDNNQIGNPQATPLQTTTYKVTVTDSLGCTASDSLTIEVANTGFIATLFSPNDDGNNDELKVYGLNDVHGFSFLIFNREGSMVYSSSDLTEVITIGWNGIVRGVKQPAGVYYWKVDGEDHLGNKVLLNGKNSGSIVLIR
jgi:gliding motility-associated-like protein